MLPNFLMLWFLTLSVHERYKRVWKRLQKMNNFVYISHCLRKNVILVANFINNY